MDAFRQIVLAVIRLIIVVCPCLVYGQKDTAFLHIPKGVQASIGNKYYTRLLETQAEYREAVKKKDSVAIGELCYLLGKRYTALGDYLTAKKWFVESLRIREPNGYSEAVGKVYLRLTENHSMFGQFEEARLYARRALINNQHVGSLHGLMASNVVLSGTYGLGYHLYEKKNSRLAQVFKDSAAYCEAQAEKYAIAMKSPNELANIYALFSASYWETDPSRAIRYSNYAMAVYSKQKDFNGMFNVYTRRAYIYTGLSRFDSAFSALSRARKLATDHHIADFVQNREIEIRYSELYQKMGKWEEAFHHLEKMHEYEVSMISADRDGAMARLGVEYETQKKELLLKAQNEELVLRNKLIIAVSVLLLLTLVMSIVFFWLFRKNKRISQLNAGLVNEQNHRVKNNLQVVSSLLGLHLNRLADPAARLAIEESQLRVQAMAVLHRKLYDGDKLVKVNLVTYIPDLVDGVLQTYGFVNLKPSYSVATLWLSVDQSVPLGLILNELVTNACKYAFAGNAHPALAISCSQAGQQITLTVSDNGPGLPARQTEKTFGMWLIEVLSEQLDGEYEFENNQGTTFRLFLNAK